MAKLSPVFNDQTIDANGDPYVGAQLFTYVAGSSTKQVVYTDAAGTVPHLNPIELNSLGFPTQGAIWIPEGISVKFVLASPTDTDPPTSPIKTIDNVQGVNDAGATVSEWQASGVSPTYIGTTSFSLAGDQTSAFHKGRRVQFTTSGGTVYGKIINTAYTSLTTVTMLMDGTDVLDSGLSVANLSILRADVPSLPNPIEMLRSAVVGHATLTPTWDRAYGEIQDVSGVVTYTAIPDAPRPGATRIWYPAAGATMTHGGNISVQGNANVTAASGDKWIITAVTTTTFDVLVVKKSGKAVVSACDIQPINVVMASNAVTLTLNPTSLDFRSATMGSGTVNTRTVPSAISTVISSGSTGGTINAVASRIILLAIDNAGTVELAWCNEKCGINLTGTTLISTTAEGGAGAADSATTIYSTTARTNVPCQIVGFFDSTQTTAGTWATAASTIQGMSGQALGNIDTRILQAVTRNAGTTYTNTTPQKIQWTIGFVQVSGTSTVTVNGVAVISGIGAALSAGAITPVTVDVLPGETYLITNTGSNSTPSVERRLT